MAATLFATPWNAYVKDELELHLHRLVCDGAIDLATAQREIVTDWITAHKRYLRTDKPLRDYATSPLTEQATEFLLELEESGSLFHSRREHERAASDATPAPTLVSFLAPPNGSRLMAFADVRDLMPTGSGRK